MKFYKISILFFLGCLMSLFCTDRDTKKIFLVVKDNKEQFLDNIELKYRDQKVFLKKEELGFSFVLDTKKEGLLEVTKKEEAYKKYSGYYFYFSKNDLNNSQDMHINAYLHLQTSSYQLSHKKKDEEQYVLNSKSTEKKHKKIEFNLLDTDFPLSLLSMDVDNCFNNECIKTKNYKFKVVSKDKRIEKTQIFLEDRKERKLKFVCLSDQKGECFLQLSKDLPNVLRVMTKKDGFITKYHTINVNKRNEFTVKIDKGRSLDIFTKSLVYGNEKNLKNINVFLDNKFLGKTSDCGFFTHSLDQYKKNELLLTLKQKKPKHMVFENKFSASNSLTVEQLFVNNIDKVMKFAVFEDQSFDSLENYSKLLKKELKSKSFFDEYLFKNQVLIPDYFLFNGWNSDDFRGRLDFIVSTHIFSVLKSKYIEFVFSNPSSKILYSKVLPLEYKKNNTTKSELVKTLVAEFLEYLPIESTVISYKNGNIVVAKPAMFADNLYDNKDVSVFSLQKSDFHLNNYSPKLISKAEITKVSSNIVRAKLSKKINHKLFSKNNLAIFTKKKESSKSLALNISSADFKRQIKGANLYFDLKWQGASDLDGNILVYHEKLKNIKDVLIVKKGYKPKSLPKEQFFKILESNSSIKLSREKILLVVDSKPQKKSFYLNGVYIDKTPFQFWASELKDSNFIELDGEDDYYSYHSSINMAKDHHLFISDHRIHLETSHLNKARKYYLKGNINKTIDILSLISDSESEYLAAQELLAKVYFENFRDYKFSSEKYLHLYKLVKNKKLSQNILDTTYYNAILSQLFFAELLQKDGKTNLAQKAYKKTSDLISKKFKDLKADPSLDINLNLDFISEFTQKRLLQYQEKDMKKNHDHWVVFFKKYNRLKKNNSDLNYYTQGVLSKFSKNL